jgi:hypothetical protein
MRNPKKKCIAKKCTDCQFYQSWDMVDEKGLRKSVDRCGIQVLFEEIPLIRGAIDGLQGGVNESRNRAIEVKEAVGDFMNKTRKTFAVISNIKQIGSK